MKRAVPVFYIRCVRTSQEQRRQTAKNGDGCVVSLLLASNTSNNKSHRNLLTELRVFVYSWRDEYTSRVVISLIYHDEGESVVFICDELANQHLIVGFGCMLILSLLKELISLLRSVQMSPNRQQA